MNVQTGLSSGFICHIRIICCIFKLILFINSFVRHINVPLFSNDNDDDLSRHRTGARVSLQINRLKQVCCHFSV